MQGSGKSSLSYWTPFDNLVTACVRVVKAKAYIAWTRDASAASFATVGASVVGGTDIIQGSGEVAINNADSFLYFDESDRVLRIEYERNLIEPLGGLSIALCDIVLDNSDNRFTPTYNATIGTALKPNRPLKIFIGLEVEGQTRLIPIIEGLSLQPREDKVKRTVTISAYDYLRWLDQKPQETALYSNQRSDEIIADILSRAGIGSASYSLDQGLNTIGFAWFDKGDTAGDRIRRICEAEEAVFYQDETGVLRFENRDKYVQAPYTTSVWNLDPGDILSWEQDTSSEIINRVLVSGKPRSVKSEAEVWRDGVEEQVPAGQTIEVWANFDDPVSSFTSPVANTDYKAYTATGGGGSDITAQVTITLTSFTKSAKLEIANASGSAAFLPLLKIRGTPATVDYEIEEVFYDSGSIEDYSENQKKIENEFIDNRTFAANLARNIVRRHKKPQGVLRLTIRGNPALQLRDRITVRDPDLNTTKEYRIIGIQGVLEGGGFTQTLRVREVTSAEGI